MELAPAPGYRSRWDFEAIGCPWRIDADGDLDAGLRERITARVDEFDRVWSRFRADSLVARLGRDGGSVRLPAEAGPLLELYRLLYEATGGRVSPLVGRRLEELGYDAAYRLTPAGTSTPVPSWADALAWDGRELTALRPLLLDVGAAGKGLLADLVSGLLAEAGILDAVVDASGDIVRRRTPDGRAPERERIALEDPRDPRRAIGVAELGDGALCASASNRRAWAGVHHVLDAVTGLPTRDVIATWVLAPDALTADGLATGLFFAPAAAFSAAGPFEWVRLFADGRAEVSPDFPGEVFR